MACPSIHVLLYPLPPSGHVIPILDLARRLLSRPGLTVTVLVTPATLPILEPFLSAHPSPSLQHLVLPAPPRPPPSVAPIDNLLTTIRGFRDLHSPALVEWFGSQASPPDVIVSDFLFGWTDKLARQLGIPRVVFSPCSASYLSIAFSLWRDLPELKDTPEVSFPDLPDCPSYPSWQLSEVYVEAGDSTMEFHRDIIVADVESWGVLFNSFAELELDYIDHTKRDYGHDRVWAVGPLMPPDDDQCAPASRGGPTSLPADDVLAWLDSCPDGSVVYVCFGSRTVLTRKQMDELAAALDLSGVRFVLCVKDPGENKVEADYGKVPDGFEDRVSGRGLVIRGWAPQVLILRHRAVCAFLTHCGWNSVMEGIMAGVVMLTWPIGADQYPNAKLLVDQLGVGIRVGEGTKKIPEAAELSRILRDSISATRPEMVRAGEISKVAVSAIKPGGSSEHDLDDFIKRVYEVKISK
ncbi:flavonol 3-O-glucosyltransferase UGT89B1-like [Punica granatum]|uniref:Uncharacterized protein n=2 Tax=Punica granatum TaxID=22663 RepID=A0A218VX96_PUNGR|nr:flavonol 3-O-glucosyltransferase UGT89B1-like [Punica granatum]OWM65194.1 hypothetical protein CDL15_Pgr008782 [Punica granatum]PKI31443.1 hypothetical protein CRG98_048156 [Punica granatum]